MSTQATTLKWYQQLRNTTKKDHPRIINDHLWRQIKSQPIIAALPDGFLKILKPEVVTSPRTLKRYLAEPITTQNIFRVRAAFMQQALRKGWVHKNAEAAEKINFRGYTYAEYAAELQKICSESLARYCHIAQNTPLYLNLYCGEHNCLASLGVAPELVGKTIGDLLTNQPEILLLAPHSNDPEDWFNRQLEPTLE